MTPEPEPTEHDEAEQVEQDIAPDEVDAGTDLNE